MTFVEKLLEVAETIGDECVKIVATRLQTSSTTNARSVCEASPSREDIALRDRALDRSSRPIFDATRFQ